VGKGVWLSTIPTMKNLAELDPALWRDVSKYARLRTERVGNFLYDGWQVLSTNVGILELTGTDWDA
jgi:hypothetical protein